jgi:hypothetical protein
MSSLGERVAEEFEMIKIVQHVTMLEDHQDEGVNMSGDDDEGWLEDDLE